MTRQGPNTGLLSAGRLPDAADIEQLLQQAIDIAIHLDAEQAVMGISVSPECPALGCLDHWVGRPIADFLAAESREKFAARVAELAGDAAWAGRPIELNHVDNATWEFPIRYTLHRVRGSAGLLMLGRDMAPIAEVQQRLVQEQMARERDQQRLRAETTFYRVVLEASDAPLVILEPDSGRIRDLNHAAASLLGSKAETLSGGSFAQALDGRRMAELMDSLQAAAGAEEPMGVEVVARRNDRPLSVHPQMFRAAGDLFLLCRLAAVEEEGGAGPEVAQSLSALFTATGDAIVLTDARGAIREANEAFLILVDAAQLRDVRGKPLSDFLVRGGIDLKLMLDSAAKSSRIRNYATQVKSLIGTRAPVEVSAARLSQRGGDLGFGLILRDASTRPSTEAQAGQAAVSDEAMRNVMELVGTASLKELVSATSDVVEKMCIETAVQMTNNNRVAAAEMLGLSRQSLYVKLRKHGMLRSEGEGEAEG